MNEDIFQGKWREMRGKVKEQWGKLTDDDLTQIDGKREQLIGKLQQRYGWAEDRVKTELDRFEKSHMKQFREKGSKMDKEEGFSDRERRSNREEDDQDYPKRKSG